jgi:hypothetical protein
MLSICKFQLPKSMAAMSVLILAGTLPMTGVLRSQTTAPPVPPPSIANSVRSPEVQADGRVTFRIYAPAATAVLIRAEGTEANPAISTRRVRLQLRGRWGSGDRSKKSIRD